MLIILCDWSAWIYLFSTKNYNFSLPIISEKKKRNSRIMSSISGAYYRGNFLNFKTDVTLEHTVTCYRNYCIFKHIKQKWDTDISRRFVRIREENDSSIAKLEVRQQLALKKKRIKMLIHRNRLVDSKVKLIDYCSFLIYGSFLINEKDSFYVRLFCNSFVGILTEMSCPFDFCVILYIAWRCCMSETRLANKLYWIIPVQTGLNTSACIGNRSAATTQSNMQQRKLAGQLCWQTSTIRLTVSVTCWVFAQRNLQNVTRQFCIE